MAFGIPIVRFLSYIYTCSIEPESRSEHFKKNQDVLSQL